MNNFSNPSFIYRFFIFLLFSIGFLTGCFLNPPPVDTKIGASSGDKVDIQVVVRDDKTQFLLSNASVWLRTEEIAFPAVRTDNNGLAVFRVDPEILKNTVEIEVQIAQYQVNRQNITLGTTLTTTVWMVLVDATPIPRETPTEIPTEIPTETPISPTLRPEDTQTPVPTDTSTPTSTPTVKATATQISIPPASPGLIFLTRREGADTVYIVAGPDVSNVNLGTLGVDEKAQVIGRTTQNEWFQVITNRDVKGWVANCEVTLLSTNLSGVPITWSGLVTPKNCGDTNSSGGNGTVVSSVGNCVKVSLTHTEWPGREFDDVLLSWSNVPSTAASLKLWVSGPTNDGVSAYVIHPTFSDTDVAYKVELFKFEDGNFKPGATYTYSVQPINAAGNVICTIEGTFVP